MFTLKFDIEIVLSDNPQPDEVNDIMNHVLTGILSKANNTGITPDDADFSAVSVHLNSDQYRMRMGSTI